MHTNAGKGLLQYALITKSRMSLNFTLGSITENPSESRCLIQSRNDRGAAQPNWRAIPKPSYFIYRPHAQDDTPGLSRTWWHDRFGNFFGVQRTLPTCPACPADYNLDGGVTGDDIAAFFIAFEQGGC